MSLSGKPRKAALVLLTAIALPIAAASAGGYFQTANMHLVATGEAASGAATLTRHANAIHLRVTGSVFTAYASYSAWFVIFNSADDCAGGPGACSADDLANPMVKAAVLNAGGFIADGGGNGYFTGSLENGSPPIGLCCFGKLGNGNKAEVHVLLLDHDIQNPGEIADHISTPTDGIDHYFFIFPPAE